MSLCLALAGPPNAGKSTLFNGLTGGKARAANHAGVTVETRIGSLTTPAGSSFRILDIPGIYGFYRSGVDVQLALRILCGQDGESPDALIIVVDAANLRTHLQALLQMRELGLPVIVALNMMDLALRDGVRIDMDKLAEILGVPVIAVQATRAAGRKALLEAMDELASSAPVKRRQSIDPASIDLKELQRQSRQIADLVILAEPGINKVTRALDRVLLHQIFGPLLFLLILFAIFQAVFSWALAPMGLIEAGAEALAGYVRAILPAGHLQALLTEGVIAGVGSVVIFLPQIVILSGLLLLLEGCGYLARISFLADELMRRCGLGGQAVIPLLSSFACAIPGIMAARSVGSERDRLVTIMIAPLMTCSARIPVYTLMVSAFIAPEKIGPFNQQGLIMFGLYLAGIAGALAAAFLYRRFGLRDARGRMLLLDLPTYKWPQWRDIRIGLQIRIGSFLHRAGTMILMVSIILWFLTSFPAGATLPDSYAGQIGAMLEPLLRPIGFNLEIAIALIPGFAAREVVVGALGTVYASGGGGTIELAASLQNAWSLPTAMAFVTWYVFAPQCLATLAVIRRETNSWKIAALTFGYMLALAWLASGLVYHLLRLVLNFS